MDLPARSSPRTKRRAAQAPGERAEKKAKQKSADGDPKLELAIITKRNQESPLLRLPGELRNSIYEYVFNGTDVTMRTRYGYRFDQKYKYACLARSSRLATYEEADWQELHSLAQVCQLLRSETRLLPFQLCNFQLHNGYAAYCILENVFKQEQRAAIGYVEFLGDFGMRDNNPEVLDSLTGLKEVTMHQSQLKSMTASEIRSLDSGKGWKMCLKNHPHFDQEPPEVQREVYDAWEEYHTKIEEEQWQEGNDEDEI